MHRLQKAAFGYAWKAYEAAEAKKRQSQAGGDKSRPLPEMFPEAVKGDARDKAGERVGVSGKSMQWWIGDWVNYGGKRYGETYKAAIDATGMSYGTVRNFASVCDCFELSRRRDNLTFNHHVEVWSLEPEQQDELLDRARFGTRLRS